MFRPVQQIASEPPPGVVISPPYDTQGATTPRPLRQAVRLRQRRRSKAMSNEIPQVGQADYAVPAAGGAVAEALR